MSFLKKYKGQFEDAKKKYMPEEKKETPAVAATPEKDPQVAPTGDKEPEAPVTAPTQVQGQTPAVPPGWTATWDEEKKQWNYTEQATGKTQHEHPDPVNYGGQSQPPGGPVLDKDGKPQKDKNGMLIGAAGGLAAGTFGKKLGGWAKKKALKEVGIKSGHKSHGHGGHGGHHGGHGEHGEHEEESSESGGDSD